MNPGQSRTIEYVHWSGQQWTASLQDVYTQINGPFGIRTTIDPDFHHVGLDTHDDEWIQYTAWDGQQWASKCHSHTDALDGSVNFTFEHFKRADLDNADHEDGTIGFVAWDGSHWLASAPKIGAIPEGQASTVFFNLERRS